MPFLTEEAKLALLAELKGFNHPDDVNTINAYLRRPHGYSYSLGNHVRFCAADASNPHSVFVEIVLPQRGEVGYFDPVDHFTESFQCRRLLLDKNIKGLFRLKPRARDGSLSDLSGPYSWVSGSDNIVILMNATNPFPAMPRVIQDDFNLAANEAAEALEAMISAMFYECHAFAGQLGECKKQIHHQLVAAPLFTVHVDMRDCHMSSWFRRCLDRYHEYFDPSLLECALHKLHWFREHGGLTPAVLGCEEFVSEADLQRFEEAAHTRAVHKAMARKCSASKGFRRTRKSPKLPPLCRKE